MSSSSSSSDISIFLPSTNDHVSEISYTHQYSSLFSNPLHKLAQNVPHHLLLMEMEAGEMNVSTGGAAAEKLWTVPTTSFNGKNCWTDSSSDWSCHENGGYIRKMSPVMEEGKLKVGRCNAEERKEKIQRYRVKRKQRNFNKTIKYVCRKTLADSRARICGRFAPANHNKQYNTFPIDGIFVNRSGDHDLGPTWFEYYAWAHGNILDVGDTFDSCK